MSRTNTAASQAANSYSRSALPRISNTGRILRCIASAKLDGSTPLAAAQRLYGGMPWVASHFVAKANEVSGHSTVGSEPGSELAGSRNSMAEFSAAVAIATALGKIREAVEIPLNTVISGLLTDPVAYSHAEGQPLKVSSATFEAVTLARARRAVLMFATQELLAMPNVEKTLAQVALRALAKELNAATFSPARTGSLTNGHSSAAGGNGWQDFDYELQSMLASIVNANPATCHFVAAPSVVLGLAGLRNDVGGFAYPNVSVKDGGELLGLPLLVADGIGDGVIAAVDGAEIIHGSGQVEIGISRDARIEANSSPTGEVTTPTGQTTIAVDLFASGAVALKIAQYQNAKMRRPDCVAALTAFDPSSAITT